MTASIGRFRIACGVFCIAAGVIFLLIDSNILARGAARWALSDLDRWSYGLMAGCIPWLIAILPFFIWLAWRIRHRGWAIAGGVLYLVFLGYNLQGAGGAIAMIRSDVVSSRKYEAVKSVDRTKERAQLASQRDAIPTGTRPPAQITALIEAEKVKPWWQYSEQCKQPSNSRERAYCGNVLKLASELGAAQELKRLSARITEIDDATQVAGWVAEIVDPHAQWIAFYTGLREADVQKMLPLANPIALMVGSMGLLGLGCIFLGITTYALAFGSGVQQLSSNPAATAAVDQKQGGGGSPSSAPAAPNLRYEPIQLARWYFSEHTRPGVSGGIEESIWYAQYSNVCAQHGSIPLPLEQFRNIARRAGAVITQVNGTVYYKGVMPMKPAEVA